ncbi:hypothetical protein DNTS_014965 [Danionella cerebrum]|uniref:Hexosyltransferase n=1 Tax=Danionella cerebrum TaxID=2873325 RepID=A0A553R6N5_9TELE|nr:hypothetical protein DNTS_014965 [Danionella translucida]
MVYTTDFSLKIHTANETLFKTVMNKIYSYNMKIEFQTPSKNSMIISVLFPTLNVNRKVHPTTTQFSTPTTSEHLHAVHPSNYHFIMDEPDKCKENPFLVFMVPVAPHQVDARNAIRSTWGNESTVQGKTILTLFLVGLPGGEPKRTQEELKEESLQHRDLIQSNFVDSYFNLTIKTMVIMDWLATRCPQANYSMKVDSDMFINVNNLITLLLRPDTPRENYITGLLMSDRPVVRNKDSKWYVSEELYPEATYPPYLLGMGYVFSSDLPGKLVNISKYIKPFNIEDAYIGACLKQLGLEPSHPPDSSQFGIYMGEYNRDNFLRVITTILESPDQLIKIWNDMFCKSCLLVCVLILINILFLYFTATIIERRKWLKLLKEPGNHRLAYPQNYEFILDLPEKCEQQKPFVVVIVPVAPENVEARNAIRITWGSERLVRDKVVLVLFLLGSRSGNKSLQEQLHNESQTFQDVIQSNFQDTYRNLTIKTLVMMDWLSKKCQQASYAVKVDADVLLNVKNLIYMLVNLKTLQHNYITGLVVTGNTVVRDPYNKFYIPHDVYSRSSYPPYPLGMCYIFSLDLPQKILHISRQVRPIFIEDAYIGMCLRRLGIAPKKPPNIGQFVVRPPEHFDHCYYSKLIAILTSSCPQLVSYWVDVQSSSKSASDRSMSCQKWFLVCILVPGTLFLLYLTYNPSSPVWTQGHREPIPYPIAENYSTEEPGLYHVAYPRNYKFLIDQSDICEEQKPYIVIVVPVPPWDVDARNGIRNTWGAERVVEGKVVLVLFLVGLNSGDDAETLQRQLYNENLQYKDILQSNFQDSYRNLTIKTMVMMEWLSKKCQQASYAVKVDADVLLMMKNLINMLVSLSTIKTNYMTGLVWYESPVIRDPSNRFFLPYDIYDRNAYPPYPLGMCYIISLDLPQQFLQQSKKIRPIYIEDAYLGMLLEKIGVVPTKPTNMDQFVVSPPVYNRCYYSGLIAVLTANTNQMTSFWTDIHSTSKPC